MSSLFRNLLLIVVAIALTCSSAVAQTPDQDRIKQLEKENDAQRQELAQLRL